MTAVYSDFKNEKKSKFLLLVYHFVSILFVFQNNLKNKVWYNIAYKGLKKGSI